MERPLLNRVWAKDGQVTPYDEEKYLKGFVAEVPTYEGLNYLQQRIDLTLNSLAERGVLEWGSDVNYQVGALAWDTNGVIYVCTSNNPSVFLNPSVNPSEWDVSVVQLSVKDFEALTSQVNSHISNVNNPHNVTAEQLNVYRRNVVDSLFAGLNNNINTHKLDRKNPHNVTATQVGAVPITGGTYTGSVTFDSDEVVLNTAAGNQAITSKPDLVGLRKDNVRVGITPDKRLVRKDGDVVTDVYMSEEEYVVKREEIEFEYSSPSPDLQIDLVSDISIICGVGISEFKRPSTRSYISKSGVVKTAGIDEPCWTPSGLNFLKNTSEVFEVPAKNNLLGFSSFTIYLEFVPTEDCELLSNNTTNTDRIYVKNGDLLVDLFAPSSARRTFNAGKVSLGVVNRFSLSFSDGEVLLFLNGEAIKSSFALDLSKQYTKIVLARNSSVSLRQLKVWSIALNTKQLSKL